MRRTALVTIVLILSVATLSAQPTSVHYKDGLLKAPAEALTSTIVTPHMESPITPGKNLLWCSSFQLVWNEASKLIGEDLHFVDEPPMVAILNRKSATKEDIDDASCLVIADWLSPDLPDRIAKAIKDKFGRRADPQLFNDIRSWIPPREPGFFAYAYLLKELGFATPFENIPAPLLFGKTPVEAFGIWDFAGRQDLLKQLKILYAGVVPDASGGIPDAEFIIELKTTSPDDRLILARVQPAKTLGETVARVQNLIAKPKTDEEHFLFDRLVVPKLNFDVTRNYDELLHRAFKVANPRAQGIFVYPAIQRIRFQLNEKGVQLHSEAAFGGLWAEPLHLVFDRPFLILMQRKNARTPYLALWIDNPELLVPSDVSSDLLSHVPFDEAADFSEGLAAVRVGGTPASSGGPWGGGLPRGGKWGFIDPAGRWVVKPQFADVGDFHDGLAAVAVIEPGGAKKIPDAEGDSFTIVDVADQVKWGYIDKTGRVVIIPQYADAEDFEGGLARVNLGGVQPNEFGGRTGRHAQHSESGGGLWGGSGSGVWGNAVDIPDVFVDHSRVEGGKWGYIDTAGNLLAAKLFDDIGKPDNGLIPVKSGDGQGYMDKVGNLLAGKLFDDVDQFHGGLAAVKAGDKWGFMNRAGRIVVEPRFARVEPFSDRHAAFDVKPAPPPEGLVHYDFATDTGLWGFIDTTGLVTSEPRFERVGPYTEGLAPVSLNGKWGFIDGAGSFVIPPRFDVARPFSEGKAAVEIGKKWGYVLKTGKFLVEPIFEDAQDFAGGLAIVGQHGKTGCLDAHGKLLAMVESDTYWLDDELPGLIAISGLSRCGYIDRTGKMVISGNFKEVSSFSDGLARVQVRVEGALKYGYIDKTGRFVIPPVFDDLGVAGDVSFSDGLVPARSKNEWGYIDRAGKWVIPAQFTEAKPFSEGIGLVRMAGGQYRFLDATGGWLTNTAFDSAESFREGMAVVKLAGQYGFLDRTGKLAIEPRFQEVESFSEDLALFKSDKKFGYIDKKGQVVIQPVFTWAGPFTGGLAIVQTEDGIFGYIDPAGRFAAKPQYDDAEPFSEGLAVVRIGAKYGYVDKSFQLVAKPRYDRADDFQGGLAGVRINGKWGYIDKRFRLVIKPRFDYACPFLNGRAQVTIVNRTRFIDTKGRFIGAAHYDATSSFLEGLAAVTLPRGLTLINAQGNVKTLPDAEFSDEFSEGLFQIWTPDGVGFVDRNAQWVIRPRSDLNLVEKFSEGLAPASKEGKYGYINRKGKWVIQPMFDWAAPFANGLARVGVEDTSGSMHFGFINRTGSFLKKAGTD